MEAFGNDSSPYPVNDLISSFIEAVKGLASSADLSQAHSTSAEMNYELDQVISNYLDLHGISPSSYDSIQQDVVNTIASSLSSHHQEHGPACQFDEHGNANLSDVITLLDHHYMSDLPSTGFPDHLFDSASFSSHHSL